MTPHPSTTAAHDPLLDAIARLARDELDHRGAVTPGMRLVEDLGLDSIRLLTLATAVEDHFRICLDEADEASLVTVGDLATLIAVKTGAEER